MENWLKKAKSGMSMTMVRHHGKKISFAARWVDKFSHPQQVSVSKKGAALWIFQPDIDERI
jgi:hypothetical protein